jgi:DNA polymerase-3 subunit epsilon
LVIIGFGRRVIITHCASADLFLESIMEFLAIDVETADWGHICEIGCVTIAGKELINPRSWLVRPCCYPALNPEHMEINKIRATELEGAPTFKELWDAELYRIIRPDAVLIAHNATFDVSQIQTEIKRNGIRPQPIRYFCTLNQARVHLKGMESYSLDSVCRFLKIDLHNHHRALADAIAAAKIFMKLPKRIAGIKVKK